MIVIDTSVWIEFLKQNPLYTSKVNELLEIREVLAVEFIFGELLQGAKNKREKRIIIDYWKGLPKCSQENVWIESGKYLSENKLFSKSVGLIDCAIIVSARRHHAKIWSLDKKVNNILKEEEKFVYSIQLENDHYLEKDDDSTTEAYHSNVKDYDTRQENNHTSGDDKETKIDK
jgi:predicted nucleic acid-binding protein